MKGAEPREVAEKYAALIEKEPKLRARDAAERLGVSEAELLVSGVVGDVVRLRPEFSELFAELESLGEVMALTRNEHAVIEKRGVYHNTDISGRFGLVLDEEIDLRLFMWTYAHAFAVTKEHVGKPLRSIQFFGGDGTALHKVYLKNKEGLEVYERLVESYRHDVQEGPLEMREPGEKPAEKPDAEIDVEAFQQDWLGLQDTHDFFGMLRTHGVTRTQALRLAPAGHAGRVDDASVTTILERASETETPIMVFVGSPGCLEIHTGPVKKIVEMGDWINVLDPRFNLHLDRSGVASSWVVKKPTEDGIVTSLELFDAEGATVAMLFGARKPGIPEDTRWRELVGELSAVEQTV